MTITPEEMEATQKQPTPITFGMFPQLQAPTVQTGIPEAMEEVGVEA